MQAFRFFARIATRSLLVLAAAFGSVSAAHAADNSITVLGIEATDGAPDTVATLITDALRQRATSERGMKLIPGRDLVDIKIMFSCPDEAPTCMAEAARNLGVGRMIFGSVKRAPGDSYVITLKMLDVGRRQVVAWVGEPLSKALATQGAIRNPVEKWFATLTGQSTTGTVRVRGDMPGISVALDGAPMGVLGAREMVLNNVPAGRREIVASKPGYAPVRKEISVVAGGSIDVALELASNDANRGYGNVALGPVGTKGAGLDGDAGSVSASLGDDNGRDALKWGSWATAAASLASFGLAIKFAFDVQYYNDRLDPFRRFECPTMPAQLCDAAGNPKPALTATEKAFVDSESQEGKNFQTYEFIALGVGGAFAIASGVLFYFAYFADDGGSVSLGPGRDAPKLRLTPYANTDGGGFAARLRF